MSPTREGDPAPEGDSPPDGEPAPTADPTAAAAPDASAATPAPGPAVTPATAAPRAAYDIVRLALACIAGFNAAWITLVIVVILRGWEPTTDLFALCVFAFSAASSFAYLLHTLRTFGRMSAPRLRQVLLATNAGGRFGRVGEVLSGTGPTIAVQWSVIAVGAVLVFTLWPGLLSETTTVFFSVLVVAASWAVTVVAYAVHYARYDEAYGGFDFPTKRSERIFSDYVYLAVQVQTTFSTSDVSLTLPGPRRLVTGHTLVSFAFNTVIIAMLITVIFIGH
ncbi:DUF1345 domain-containing protein [Agromyces sp. LHK192]|uniref:DUF1345 domain-containing protein n=1 Tax=Agromyces sp. LHK192 TaxID=2498704 RepID=UPI000FDA4156|nr:DUF1345 domain-containing protein [Agromyces sp. LHK192]